MDCSRGFGQHVPVLVTLVGLCLLASPLDRALSDEERRAAVAVASREQLEQAMRETPVDRLIQMGQSAASALGTYSYRMRKQERVKGELLQVQEIITTVREAPFSVRLEYVKGDGKGRRVLFNPTVRKQQFRVREAGFLSIFGALWIDVDSGLAKKDSNHTIREAGFGNLLARFARDFQKAAPLGGFAVKHEGWNPDGHFCSLWMAPNNGVGFDSAKTRICTDLTTGMPSDVESWDLKGTVLEKYEFSEVSKQTVAAIFFQPDGI